jgi:hypothetical protein
LRAELPKATRGQEKAELQRTISIIESRAKGYSKYAPETMQAAARAVQDAMQSDRPQRKAPGQENDGTGTSSTGAGFVLLRIGIIAVAVLCFTIGPLAAYKGVQALKSAGFRQASAAVRALVCGIALFVLGLVLIYTLFTF